MTATFRMARNVALGALTAVGAVCLTGAPAQANYGLPEGHEPANLDPADFTTKIDNPYYPLRPGDRRVYRETAPDGTRYKIVDVVVGLRVSEEVEREGLDISSHGETAYST